MDLLETEKQIYLEKKSYVFLHLFKGWMWRILFIVSILQCIFFSNIESIFSVLCVLMAWFLTDKIVLTEFNLTKYTYSSFIILGYSLTNYCFPIIFTLLEGKPITYNLHYPFSVFFHSLLGLLALILSHSVYKNSRTNGVLNIIYRRMRDILAKWHLYTPIANSQVWFIGISGLVGMIITYFVEDHYDDRSEGGGTISKVFQGLIPYAYAPFFLILKRLYNPLFKSNSKNNTQIYIYSVILLFVGIAGNSRGLFMKGFTSLGIAYFMGLLINIFSYKIFTIRNMLIAFFSFWLISGPLSDLGTAMVTVRAIRSDISAIELVSQTFNAYIEQAGKIVKNEETTDKTLILQHFQGWDETYLDNLFITRFANLKYNDLSLEQYYKINDTDPGLQNYSFERTMAVFPQPILNILNINIDKTKALQGSYGDFLYYRNQNNSSEFSGFRVGHFAGIGMATFGWWYLLVLFILLIPCYLLIDLLYFRNIKFNYYYFSLTSLINIALIFSFIGLLSNNIENPIVLLSYIIRGWPQAIILYLTLYNISKFFLKLFHVR